MIFRESIKEICASLTVIISIYHSVSKCNFYLYKVLSLVFIMFIHLDLVIFKIQVKNRAV